MAQDTIVTGSKLTTLANAIRTKGGTSAQMTLDQMAQAVAAIPTGSGGGSDKFALEILGYESDYDVRDVDISLSDWPTYDSSTMRGLTWIRPYAFYDSSSNMAGATKRLNSIEIPEWITGIGAYAFFYNRVRTISLEYSATQLYLANAVFQYAQDLTSFETNGRKIYFYGAGNSHFANCYLLKELDLDIASTSIPSTFCYYDSNLQTVKLRGDIQSIGTSAFSNCRALESFVLDTTYTTDAATITTNTFTALPNNCKIYVPDAMVNTYKNATNWSTLASQIYPISEYVEV